MNKAEELIACLEGEIAKRDARIVELENAAESLRISRDYHHEQEVEYRRRWAGLYAAPVSDAKAQCVVMPERRTDTGSATDDRMDIGYTEGWNGYADEFARLNAAPVQQVSVPDGSRLVTTDWLKRIHRDLDACQKVIWANLRGCDPSYYEDAQERLREIDAMLSAAPAAPAADAGLVEALDRIARSAASHIEQGERPDLVTVSHWACVAFSAIDAREAV